MTIIKTPLIDPLSVPASTEPSDLILPVDVADLVHAATAENTRRAYQTDLKRFLAWGGHLPSSPEELARYLTDHHATHKPSTLARWLASLAVAHRAQGLADPTKDELVHRVLRGIRNTVGVATKKAPPALKEIVLQMAQALDDSLRGKRDRALILIGFAGAMRRSELVGLTSADIEWPQQGMVVTLRRSKTDQAGEGRRIGIPHARGAVCPVRSLREWLDAASIGEGPLFRAINRHGDVSQFGLTDRSVNSIIKAAAHLANLAKPESYTGHSLRAGLPTSAAAARVPFHKIKGQTRHASDAMLLHYIRDGELFIDNPAGIL